GLLPEIERFRATMGARPAVVVRLSQPAGMHELLQGKVDMAIARGPADRPGYRCDRLPASDWAGPGDCLIAPEGTAECPEVIAVRDWLLGATARRAAPARAVA